MSFGGIVGILDPVTGAVRTFVTGEEIENSFAVDRHGTYIVSDKAMYRFEADGEGSPAVFWRAVYRNSGIRKKGQVDAGSGTTPTLLGSHWVAITDNADPMDVVVYNRSRRSRRREVCVQRRSSSPARARPRTRSSGSGARSSSRTTSAT